MKRPDREITVVLGMHRSGTSVIARGLQVMGVDLGNNLMPPSEGNNSRGFWEDVDINSLNIEMLRALQIDWHFLTPMQLSDVDELCKAGYLQRALDLLQQKTAGTNVFGFKDPRVAKLLAFWKKVFTDGQMSVNYVLVIRHPLSVCNSLAKRDGFDLEKSYLLWLEHVVGSLAGTEGENRVLVDYDIFMQSPATELARVAQELHLPMNVAELQRFQLEFLDPRLQHTMYSLEDLIHDSRSGPLVQEVYSSLLDVAAGKVSLADSALKNKVREWEEEFSHLRSTLVYIDKLGQKISGITAERNVLLQERTQLIQAFMAKDLAVQNLRAELSRMYQSRSWRWTAPLRRFFSLFKQSE